MRRAQLRGWLLAALMVTSLVLVGCAKPAGLGSQPTVTAEASGATISPDATPSPGGTPTPGDTGTIQQWQLRYLLLGHYPDFAFCDPDFWPVARDDEQSAAQDWWAHADRNSPEIRAILDHLGYREPLTKQQQLTAYRDHKKLAVIILDPRAGGYGYQLSTSSTGQDEPDQTASGFISASGTIDEDTRTPRLGGCPICLEADARIATPAGAVRVAQLRPGDLVWTVDATARRVAAPIERIVRRPTPGPHLMLRLVLSDGRELIVAGGHPAVDGRYLRELRTGGSYDGAVVSSVSWVVSTAPATYDILPAGGTGTYWANGIQVASTITP